MKKKEKIRNVKRQGVEQERQRFLVSICQLIFKQQAGSVLVTDKDPGLSSHSLTSSHSALLSGRHLESGKQLRARRERPQRDGGCLGGDLCLCVFACVCPLGSPSVQYRLCLRVCLLSNLLFLSAHVCGTTPVRDDPLPPLPLAPAGMHTHIHTRSACLTRKIKR